jgi:hypothetical protein
MDTNKASRRGGLVVSARSELRQWAESYLSCSSRSCFGDDRRYLLIAECAIGFDEQCMVLPRRKELLQGRT